MKPALTLKAETARARRSRAFVRYYLTGGREPTELEKALDRDLAEPGTLPAFWLAFFLAWGSLLHSTL